MKSAGRTLEIKKIENKLVCGNGGPLFCTDQRILGIQQRNHGSCSFTVGTLSRVKFFSAAA